MNFKMNVPALCANEVYTLTFNHNSESEKVQIKVGNLTLETSEKRVVFTTTNSTSVIESDTELFDIDLYEGVYTSDLEDGEYVEESKCFLLGKSIRNLFRREYYREYFSNIFPGSFTEDGYQLKRWSRVGDCGIISSPWPEFAKKEDINTIYTVIVRIRRNTFPSDMKISIGMSHTGYVKKGEAKYEITGGTTGIFKSTLVRGSYNIDNGQDCNYWGKVYDYVSTTEINRNDREDLVGCEIEYAVQIFEGDYYDSDLITEHFEGIGCVKAPRIQTTNNGENLFPMITEPTKIVIRKGEEVFLDQNNVKSITSNNGFMVNIGGRDICCKFSGGSEDDFTKQASLLNNVNLEPGNYILSAYFNFDTETKDYSSVRVVIGHDDTKTALQLAAYKNYGMDSYKSRKYYVLVSISEKVNYIYVGFTTPSAGVAIEDITLLKITEEEYKALNYPTYKGESNLVTTPDTVELHGTLDNKGEWYGDKLDLNSSKVMQYYDSKSLFDILSVCNTTTNGYQSANGFTYVDYDISGLYPEGTIKIDETTGCAPVISDRFETKYSTDYLTSLEYPAVVCTNTTLHFALPDSVFSGVSISNAGSALATLYNYLSTNPIKVCIPLNTPNVIELADPLKPLKMYENGGVYLDSKQVRPELSTTVPVGNTFNYTGLESNTTYTIQFEGKATLLMCGGTPKTNPVSPCTITCGTSDTNLSIMGTGIRNVRVIQANAIYNLVNTNSTGSHVDLSEIKYLSHVYDKKLFIKDPTFTSCNSYGGSPDYRINTDGSIYCANNTNNCSAKFDTDIYYKENISLMLVEFDVTMPSSTYCAEVALTGAIPVEYTNFREMKMKNDTASICQGSFDGNFSTKVKNGHFCKLLYINNPLHNKKFSVILHTGATVTSSYIADGNNAEGSVNGYTYVGARGCTVSNFKLSVIKNYPEGSFNSITSMLRSNNGLGVVWSEDINHATMLHYGSIIHLPTKLRSLNGVRDKFNLLTGEYSKYIIQDELTGNFSTLKTPIVNKIKIEGNSIPFFRNGYYMCYTTDSDVYPTTKLTPASTNTYHIGTLEANKVYTIRYDGTADNVRLGLNDNIVENNSLITTGRSSNVNLTFVNPVGVDNVMLFKEDVRDQDINYFTGIDTVQVKDILSTKYFNNISEMWSNEYKQTVIGDTLNRSLTVSLSGGTFNAFARGLNSSKQVIGILAPELMENGTSPTHLHYKQIMKAGVTYIVKYTLGVTHLTNGTHSYVMRFYDKYGSPVKCKSLTNQNYTDEAFKVEVASGSTDKVVTFTPEKDVWTCGIYVPDGIRWNFALKLNNFTVREADITEADIYRCNKLNQIVTLNKYDDTTFDTYNPITGEYVQNTKLTILDGSDDEKWADVNYDAYTFDKQDYLSSNEYKLIFNKPYTFFNSNDRYVTIGYNQVNNQKEFRELLKENPIYIIEKLETPITTTIKPTDAYFYQGGHTLIDTVTNKVFPNSSYSLKTINMLDTTKWNKDSNPISLRNINNLYINNDSHTPITIPESKTLTLTNEQCVNNKIIIDQSNTAMVMNGDYTGRDIPYFKGVKSVEGIEIETGRDLGSPTFNKGGRK